MAGVRSQALRCPTERGHSKALGEAALGYRLDEDHEPLAVQAIAVERLLQLSLAVRAPSEVIERLEHRLLVGPVGVVEIELERLLAVEEAVLGRLGALAGQLDGQELQAPLAGAVLRPTRRR